MTTIIVTADGEIAADGLSMNGHDRKLSRTEAKIHVRDGVIYALSGTAAMTEPLIGWLTKHQRDPDKLPKCEGSWSLLVIDANGITHYCNKVPFRDPVEVPFAIGSGGDYALGAVAAGADARRAIEIAALYDTYTGGDIHVINIAEALRVPMKEAAE